MKLVVFRARKIVDVLPLAPSVWFCYFGHALFRNLQKSRSGLETGPSEKKRV